MNVSIFDFDDPLLIWPPIAGGDGEGEDGGAVNDDAAGDPGGGDPGEGQQDGQPGDEGQAEGDPQQGGPQDGQMGQPGMPGGPGGDPTGAVGNMIPYSRFKEVNEELRQARAERAMLLQRFAGEGGQGGQQPAQRQLPAEYAELDKGMGGYMRHYLNPVADYLVRMDERLSTLADEAKFYRGVGRNLNEQQADMVEQTRDALSQKLRQPVERADALLFLRGHPQHGKLFVDRAAQQQQQLANGVNAARRQAGAVGGRKPVARQPNPGTVDLNTLPRAQRVQVFERAMANTPV